LQSVGIYLPPELQGLFSLMASAKRGKRWNGCKSALLGMLISRERGTQQMFLGMRRCYPWQIYGRNLNSWQNYPSNRHKYT